MKKISVKINQLLNFNRRSDIRKANKVKLLIEDVINNQKFRDDILSADFKDRRFVDEKGNTVDIQNNQEILNKIIAGKEQFTDEEIDFEWDLRIALYRSLTT